MADLAALKIVIEADLSKADEAFQRIVASLGNLDAAFNGSRFTAFNQSVTEAAKAVNILTKEQANSAIQGERLSQAQNATAVSAEKLAQAQTAAAIAEEKLAQAQNATATTAEKLASEQSKAAAAAEKVTQAQINTEAATIRLMAAESRLEEQERRKAEATDKAAESAARAAARAEQQNGAYSQLSAKHRELANEAKNIGALMGVDSQFFKDAAAAANIYGNRLKSVDSALGNYGRNVGNYKSHWDGVRFTFMQMAREVPSTFGNINQMFLALSNNIPMFTDEVRKARTEGQSWAKVLGTVGSALFSWQTAMLIGITYLTKNADKIKDWITGSEGARKQAEELKKAQDKLNEAYQSGLNTFAEASTRLKVLASITTDANKPLNERIAAYQTMKREYPELLSNYSKEDVLNKNFAETLDKKLIPQLWEAARARAAMLKAQAISGRDIDLSQKQAEASKKYGDQLKKTKDAQSAAIGAMNANSESSGKMSDVLAARAYKEQRALKIAANEYKNIRRERIANQKEFDDLVKQASNAPNVGDTLNIKPDNDKKSPEEKEAERRAKAIAAIYSKWQSDLAKDNSDLSGGFIDKKGFEKDIYDISDDALKALNRLHVSWDSAMMVNISAFRANAKKELDYILQYQEMLKANTALFNNSDKVGKTLNNDNLKGWQKQADNYVNSIKHPQYENNEYSLDEIVSQEKKRRDIIGKERKDTEEANNRMAQSASEMLAKPIDAVIEALASGEDVGDALINTFKQMAVQLAEMAVQALLFKTIMGSVSGGGGGILSGLFGGLLGGGIPHHLADGGIISGPTPALMGEYPGARTNPEVVAPLDKLKNIIGSGGGSRVIIPDVQLKGQDIWLSFNRADKSRNR